MITVEKKYKCGCIMNDATIKPCLFHLTIIDDKYSIVKHNTFVKGDEFKLNNSQFKEIVEMLESEEKERL